MRVTIYADPGQAGLDAAHRLQSSVEDVVGHGCVDIRHQTQPTAGCSQVTVTLQDCRPEGALGFVTFGADPK